MEPSAQQVKKMNSYINKPHPNTKFVFINNSKFLFINNSTQYLYIVDSGKIINLTFFMFCSLNTELD